MSPTSTAATRCTAPQAALHIARQPRVATPVRLAQPGCSRRRRLQAAELSGQRRRPDVSAAGFDPSSFERSPLMESEGFQREMEELGKSLFSITPMIRRFADFDLTGKRLVLEQIEGMAERFQLVMKRLELADDPVGNMLLRQQRVQMLEAGMSLQGTMESLQAEIADMRKLIELEESTADVQLLERVKQAFRERFTNAVDIAQLYAEDPELALIMATEPQAVKAVQEMAQDPSKIEDYRDNPRLYGALQKLLAHMRGGGA